MSDSLSTPNRNHLIAVAGNPNAGKTTLFNALTGLHYKVANYPGVTVEKREGKISFSASGSAAIVDLPGTYTLFGQAPDELIAANTIIGVQKGERVPDLVVCVIDASNLERNLFLASQIIDSGVRVILVLNMMDIAERRGITIRKELLSKELGVPVHSVVASKRVGVDDLKRELSGLVQSGDVSPKRFDWCQGEGSSQFLQAATDLGKLAADSLGFSSNSVDPRTLGIGLLSGARIGATPSIKAAVLKARDQLSALGVDCNCFEAEQRYRWISAIVSRSCVIANPDQITRTERIDSVITHRVWGMVIFLALMGFIFQSIFTWASFPMDLIDRTVVAVGNYLGSHLPDGDLRSLVVDGIVAGVGSVIIFIPQIAILYFFISLLEDSGYLARAAFLMDSVMRKVGLQGRSFVPLLSSFACAIPGIMATRTIPSPRDRLATILVAPLMSCSARLPVYALLVAAFIPTTFVWGIFSLQGLTLMALYLIGILGAALVALILKFTLLRGNPSHLVMEMPPYRLPSVTSALWNAWDRSVLFLKGAGTIILALSVVLWFLASHPKVEPGEGVNPVRESYAGQIGVAIEPFIQPLGFDWRIGVGIIASFAAREVFVSSMATVFNLEDVDESSDSMISTIRQATNERTGELSYSPIVAISLMVFFAYACQCISTLAICYRETGGWRWPAFMFIYMTVLAYLAALLTFQVGSRL